MNKLQFVLIWTAAIPALAVVRPATAEAASISPVLQVNKAIVNIALQPEPSSGSSAKAGILKIQGMGMMAPAPSQSPAPAMGKIDDKTGKPMGMGMMPMPPAAGGMPGMAKMDDKMKPSGTPGMPAAGMPMPPGGLPGPAGRMTGSDAPPPAVSQGQSADPLDHIEGRIAFMRAELLVTDAQAPAWDQFAQSLRVGRLHVIEAREALSASGGQPDPMSRLTAYEKNMSARLDALRTTRESFDRLNAVLDDTQKQVASELVLPTLQTF